MKSECEIDLEVQKQLNKKIFIIGMVLMIIGIVGLFVYLIIGSIFEKIKWLNYFLFSSIPFTLGLLSIINTSKINNSLKKNKIKNIYSFEESFMNVTTCRNGEEIGTNKVYYSDLVKIKETNKFLFLYPNRYSAYPIKKNSFDKVDYEILKYWITIGKKGENNISTNNAENSNETSKNQT